VLFRENPIFYVHCLALADLFGLIWRKCCLRQPISLRSVQPICPGYKMTIRIVLADNHQVVRQGLAQLLVGEPDMRVVGEAGDYSTTIKLIQEFSPQVVIMDISMPDLNGVEATRRLLSHYPRLKVIGLSMHSDSLFVLNMLNAGASGYLLKDCALEELVKAIRAVVNQKIYLSSNLSNLLVTDLANKLSFDDSCN
jgi:two-component system, NarL family, response regulator NreC